MQSYRDQQETYFNDQSYDWPYKQLNKKGAEPKGVELTNINNNTTGNDYEQLDSDSSSDFENDDKSYETSNDSAKMKTKN